MECVESCVTDGMRGQINDNEETKNEPKDSEMVMDVELSKDTCNEESVKQSSKNKDEKMLDDSTETTNCTINGSVALGSGENSNNNRDPVVDISSINAEIEKNGCARQEDKLDAASNVCVFNDCTLEKSENDMEGDTSVIDERCKEDEAKALSPDDAFSQATEDPFCDMSDLAYVTKIVSQEPTKQKKLNTEPVSGSLTLNDDSFLERASKQLGKALVAIDSDSSGTEDSSESTTDSSSSSQSSSSSSSSSESSDENDASIRKTIIEAERNEGDNQKPPKTKDEILPEELPVEPEVIEELPENAKLEPLGEIQSFVELMLVVKALKDMPALDTDTVFFREDRKPLGRVYDVFGPVQSPFYVIRFDREENFKNMSINVGENVFYAPNFLNFTKYVFVEQLKKMKGSDASWQHDQEPPPELIDYSDDEEESKAKAAAKKKRQSERKHFLDDAMNDADCEDDAAALNEKNRKGKRRQVNVRNQPGETSGPNGSNFHHGVQNGGSNDFRESHRGRGSSIPHQMPLMPPFRHARLPQGMPIRQAAPSYQLNPQFRATLFERNNIPGAEPNSHKDPFFPPPFPLQSEGHINGDSRFSNQNLTENMVTRDTSPRDYPDAHPPPQGPRYPEIRGCFENLNANFAPRLPYGPEGGQVPKQSEQQQGPSFRPGYVFPPPAGGPWPRFDPTIPPPHYPPGLPPPNAAMLNRVRHPNLPPPKHVRPPTWRPRI